MRFVLSNYSVTLHVQQRSHLASVCIEEEEKKESAGLTLSGMNNP